MTSEMDTRKKARRGEGLMRSQKEEEQEEIWTGGGGRGGGDGDGEVLAPTVPTNCVHPLLIVKISPKKSRGR